LPRAFASSASGSRNNEDERHGDASPCQCVQFYARLIATAAG